MRGEQPAVIDRELFDAVQAKRNKQLNNHWAARMKSEAMLAGRIFDDRGNRMSTCRSEVAAAAMRGSCNNGHVATTAKTATCDRIPILRQSEMHNDLLSRDVELVTILR